MYFVPWEWGLTMLSSHPWPQDVAGGWVPPPPVDTLLPFFSSSAQVFSTWVLPFKLDSLRTWGEERKSSREFSISTGPQPWWDWRHFPSKSYELQHTPHPCYSLCHSTLLFRPLEAKYHPETGLDLCLLSYEKFHWSQPDTFIPCCPLPLCSVATQPTCPAKLKICVLWPFMEESADFCPRPLVKMNLWAQDLKGYSLHIKGKSFGSFFTVFKGRLLGWGACTDIIA